MDKIPSEDFEQIALINYLKLNKIDHFSVPNGSHLAGNARQRVIQMNKLKATGLVVGCSDLVIFLPNHILFLEMKRQPKKLNSGKLSYTNSKTSKEQLEFMDMLKKYNYTASAVAHGYEKAIKIIEGLK